MLTVVYLQVLTVDQEIIVCNPVLVLFENGKHANVLSLPWHPAVMQAYHLEVHGGIAGINLNVIKAVTFCVHLYTSHY